MALIGRSQFAFESIGQVLDRAESESSWSGTSASSDDSSRHSGSGSSRPSSMKPSSKKDRSRRDSRPYSVRFDDEVVTMGDVVGDEKEGKVPSPDKAVVPVRKMAEMREVGPVFRPLPMSLFQLWESQAQFTALMQIQMQQQAQIQQQQQQQQQQMLFLPPWAVLQNPWMMGHPQMTGMMMMTPMTNSIIHSSTTTPLGSFAYCHPCFNPLTTHGVAMTAAQQTYQTAFAQQLLRYTCPGPGGPPQAMMMMNMTPSFGYGWPNPYGVPQPFPLMPAAVYGKSNLP